MNRLIPAFIIYLTTLACFGGTEFGTEQSTESALIGILYDLKQTQNRKPTNVSDQEYVKVLNAFLSSQWDENILNRYYKAAAPLYTTQIYIPEIDAGAAPKAFGVEKIVKPSRWVIHYKAQVSPPESGRWRFWGYGDDMFCVAVDAKLILVNNWSGIKFPSIQWKSSQPLGQNCGSGKLAASDWVELKAGEIVDLDVLVGERPGGKFSAYLMIEKEGVTYERKGDSTLYPIFQLSPNATQPPDRGRQGPAFSATSPIWKALQ